MKKRSFLFLSFGIFLLLTFGACSNQAKNKSEKELKALPRSTAKAENVDLGDVAKFVDAMKESGLDLHSLMVFRHGNVVYENWYGDNAADKIHVMNSVSKTYTSMAFGFAVQENLLNVSDKVISFFPDKLPAEISPELASLEIRHLLTMSAGQDLTLVNEVRGKESTDWVKSMLAVPFIAEPGTKFEYSSMATFLVSAIIQMVTGEKVIDYLTPRLFEPLGIAGAEWDESPQGINVGGSGLFVKTEDMAKLGQFILQKGMWNGKQLLAASYIEEASTAKITKLPKDADPETKERLLATDDWMQGYGYQMWQCRHNAFRADGAGGQFIIMVPEKDAVLVATSKVQDMQAELDLIWDYLLPALK
jgi:CubicO group peptidase (beta-lactamase class C family)